LARLGEIATGEIKTRPALGSADGVAVDPPLGDRAAAQAAQPQIKAGQLVVADKPVVLAVAQGERGDDFFGEFHARSPKCLVRLGYAAGASSSRLLPSADSGLRLIVKLLHTPAASCVPADALREKAVFGRRRRMRAAIASAK